MTTLHLDADTQDGLRKVGHPEERRTHPQVVVGPLLDRSGFPPQIGRHEDHKAETSTSSQR